MGKRSNTKTILGRTTTKTYSNPDDEYGGTKYYSSPDKADDLVKTKLITKKSGQKVIKRKGEKREKVDSFYEQSPMTMNRPDLERNSAAMMKVKNPLQGLKPQIGGNNLQDPNPNYPSATNKLSPSEMHQETLSFRSNVHEHKSKILLGLTPIVNTVPDKPKSNIDQTPMKKYIKPAPKAKKP